MTSSCDGWLQLSTRPPTQQVEEEPITRMRTFSPFCRAWVTLGSVAGAGRAGTSQGGLIGGATGGTLASSACGAAIKRQEVQREFFQIRATFRAIPLPMR